jgi:hypothetical protein
MHTSTRLVNTDFQFFRHDPTGAQAISFADFCPDYHELDRVGVVSPTLEAGVYQTSYALLALTTAFYDRLRARGGDFFDYPQHFAFVGATGDNICTDNGSLPLTTPKLWDAWSWLDVWPANKWVTAPVTVAEMLQRVFDYQINRLFWPRALQADGIVGALPPYLWKMLRTSVKAVYYYGDAAEMPLAQGDEQVELRIRPAAHAIVKESLERLPEAVRVVDPVPISQCYKQVSVEAFLADQVHSANYNLVCV